MFRLFLALICLLAARTSSNGQTFFHTYTSTVNSMGGASVAMSPDGNFFVGGMVNDSAMVMKLDQSGDVLWTLAFKPEGVVNSLNVTSLNVTSDGYLIGTAVTIAPSTFFPDNGCYFKMDLNGNVQFCRAVTGVPYRFTMRKILELTTSSYIIMAAHEPTSGSYQDPMCIKVNGLTGDVVSESPRYDFENVYIDDISESILSPDKNFIYSTGRLYVSGASNGKMRVFLTKFDTSGNLLWTNYFIYDASATSRLYGSCLLYDNDTLVIGYFGDNTSTSSNFELGMLKVDTAGNMAWCKHYNVTASTFERTFRILKTNAGYALIGFVTGATQDLMSMSVDENGNVLWCKSYGTPDYDEFNTNAFGSLPAAINNDTIYITGRQQLTATTSAMVLVKHDPNGLVECLQEDSLDVTTIINPVNTEPRVISAIDDSVAFAVVDVFTFPVVPNPCDQYNHFLGNDTSFCSGALVLNPNLVGAQLYHWNNGSTESTLNVDTTGTYAVTVTLNCCVVPDTIEVLTGIALTNAQDIFICAGDSALVGDSIYTVSGVYSDTLATAFGCDSVVSVSITVNPAPDVIASADDSICLGESLDLDVTGAIVFEWFPAAGLSCSDCPSPVFSGDTTTSVVVTGTDANGCAANDTVIIQVLDAPAVDPEPATVFCGEPDTLIVNPQDVYTYHWSPGTGLSDTISPQPLANPTANTTYTFTVTANNGCETTDQIAVGVAGIPYSITQDLQLCQGDSVFIGTSVYTAAGNYVDTLATVFGCDSVVQINLTMDTLPVIHVTGPDTLCAGTPDTLTASGAETYAWQPALGLNCNDCSITSVSIFGTSIYTVVGTDDNGCSADTIIQLNVVPIPVITIPDPPVIYCHSGVTVSNESLGSYSFVRSPAEGLNSTTAPSPDANPNQTTTYTVVATDSFGCQSEAEVVISVFSGGYIAVPNAFSPNNDGLNDLFRLITICPVKLHYFKVFDRWGELVYQTADIETGWNGLYRNQACEVGVYVYVVSGSLANGESVFLKGNVSLLR